MRRTAGGLIGLPDTPNRPKPVFRSAFENDLFAAPVEPWLRYADARAGAANGHARTSSHDGERAKACLEFEACPWTVRRANGVPRRYEAGAAGVSVGGLASAAGAVGVAASAAGLAVALRACC